MDFQIETTTISPEKPSFLTRLKRRVATTYKKDTPFCRWIMGTLWAVSSFFFAIMALGMPTGWGVVIDIILFIAAGTLVIGVVSNVFAVVLALIGLRVPRLLVGTLLSLLIAVFLIFWLNGSGWLVALAVSAFASIAGILIGIALGGWTLQRTRKFKTTLSITSTLLFAAMLLGALGPSFIDNHAGSSQALANAVVPLQADDPGQAGSYSYSYFTYGSGHDKRRSEYSSEVRVTSSSVDASVYIRKWPSGRTKFWGFDQRAFPLNGRVWMPDGQGPFPLVLIVHGNHLAENYSDRGYNYLGELLASRGYIAVSVDENFLNYSVWTGIPDNDMTARAWLLLKHLQQIDTFAGEPNNPFNGKVDMSRIGLIGHSRGGQAVAMAADAKRWFLVDKTIPDLNKYQISSVVAIAPTDLSIDGSESWLTDTNYMVLQGAQDGDVNDFFGDRQYNRTSFSEYSQAFKTSLYVAGANHSQFNTDWGGRDSSYPGGILLSRSNIMDADQQRKIAKTYVSAFLEATLHDQSAYIPLFQDYRVGLSWLPSTTYFNRYENANYVKIATFDDDLLKKTINGGTADAHGVTWTEEDMKDREDQKRGTRGLKLQWNGSTSASYELNLNRNDLKLNTGSSNMVGLSFCLANMNYQLKSSAPPKISIELQSDNGVSIKLPINNFMPVQATPVSTYSWNRWLEKQIEGGKYKNTSEAVYQTYRLYFAAFTEREPKFNPDRLNKIIFHLEGGPSQIMLDDISYIQDRRNAPGRIQTS